MNAFNQHFGNHTAIVTGGAAGIGRALCEQLARSGARVIVVDTNIEGARQVAEFIRQDGGQAEAIQADVANALQIEAVINEISARHGRLDFLFNNAAIAAVGEFRDGNMDDFRRVVEVNLFGVVYGTAAAYRVMLRQKSGHIVNISSMTGLMPVPILSAYSTTKSAILAFSTGLRLEAAALGVKVSVACPGLVRTDIAERSAYWNVRKDEYLRWLPGKRFMLTPAQAADSILRGVRRNKDIIMFPFSARLGVRVYRICPPIFGSFFRHTLKTFRTLRIKP